MDDDSDASCAEGDDEFTVEEGTGALAWRVLPLRRLLHAGEFARNFIVPAAWVFVASNVGGSGAGVTMQMGQCAKHHPAQSHTNPL